MIKTIYTDGANTPSKDHSGWAIIVMKENTVVDMTCCYYPPTTNNKMELMGLLEALQYANDRSDEEFIILCDSEYAIKSVTLWISSWMRNGWVTTKKEPVKNIELMKDLYNLYTTTFNVRIQHVDGHCGNGGNELADALATNNARKFKKIIKEYDYELVYKVQDEFKSWLK